MYNVTAYDCLVSFNYKVIDAEKINPIQRLKHFGHIFLWTIFYVPVII